MTPPPNLVTSERDWRDELIGAGVLVPTKFIDDNGNRVYRMGVFPSGEQGRRLRLLFDEHVEGQSRHGTEK
jgi:hypothetical protein